MNEIRTSAGADAGADYAWSVRRGLASAALVALVVCLVVPAAGAGTTGAKPAIAGVTLDGKRVSLASLRGKPVLINVWSSW